MPKNSDVLLVMTPYPGLSFETTNIPLGLAWLSAGLKQRGFSTRAYDLQVESRNLADLGAAVEESRPRVIGIQFHGQASFNHSMDVLKYLKKTFPRIPLIVGGQQATFTPMPIMEQGYADYLVLGEGDFILPDLVRYELGMAGAPRPEDIPSLFYRRNGKILQTGRAPRIDDLSLVPLPDYDAFNWKKYPQWAMVTSRGCPYHCMFCSSCSFWQHTVRFRSAEDVLNEMQMLYEKYGVNSVVILDDTFTLKKSRVKEICQGILDRKLPTTWGCGTRVDQIDEETINLLKGSGCIAISFGIETANQSTLDLIRKEVTVEQQRRAVQLGKQAGLETRTSVMVGLPGESAREIRNTLDFLIETQPNEIQIYPIMPYDGTAIRQDMDTLGISICNHDPGAWTKDSLHPIAETKWLSLDEITQITREMVSKLQEYGYTHMTGHEHINRRNLDKVVGTALTPYQNVKSGGADALTDCAD